MPPRDDDRIFHRASFSGDRNSAVHRSSEPNTKLADDRLVLDSGAVSERTTGLSRFNRARDPPGDTAARGPAPTFQSEPRRAHAHRSGVIGRKASCSMMGPFHVLRLHTDKSRPDYCHRIAGPVLRLRTDERRHEAGGVDDFAREVLAHTGRGSSIR